MGDFIRGYESGWQSCLSILSEQYPVLAEESSDGESVVEGVKRLMEGTTEHLRNMSTARAEN
jgi:hypothetical protein